MNSKIHIKREIEYELTKSQYVCLKTPYGDHISNATGKIILDYLKENNMSLDDLIVRYQGFTGLNFDAAALDVSEYLGSLKTIGLLEYDESYFDRILISRQFNVAGEREYQKISDAIIDQFEKPTTLFSNYTNRNSYNPYLIRTKSFNHQELYFYSETNQQIQSIIGIANLSERNTPASIILVQTNDFENLLTLFGYLERELIRLNVHKLRSVFSVELNNTYVNFLNSVGFFQEGELIKEDRKSNYLIYSKILLES